MSHIQGTDYVGSMVVFEDGLPKKSEYRRFKIKTVDGNDDFAAMEEVLTRRLNAYLAERKLPAAEREGKFAYPPQLLLVDGGKGQLAVAERVLQELGPRRGDPRAPRWPSGSRRSTCRARPTPSACPASPRRSTCCSGSGTRPTASPSRYHRELRGKRMTTSVLDDIPGLGPARRSAWSRSSAA